MWDVLIKNGRVVDPMNGRDGFFDVAVEAGHIAAVGPALGDRARVVEDAGGLLVVPGIVDAHLHLGSVFGSPYGARMAALAGVTTCLDMAGPVDEILGKAPDYGAGLNVAVMECMGPNSRFGTIDPGKDKIRAFTDEALEKGALGIKLLGGHSPLSAEACRRTIEVCRDRGCAVAWHAGSTTAGSDLTGLREAVGIAGGMPLHLAHINAYCRGRFRHPEEEAREAIGLLEANPNIWSESYLSPYNGTHLTCGPDGEALDHVTRQALALLGLPPTAEGIRTAIRRGLVLVLRDTGEVTEMLRGEEAVREWEKRGTRSVAGCFPVNPASSRLMLATAKRADGTFVVDAIGTDGGCIPRNVMVENGMALARFGALTLSEFVIKTSLSAARHLRLFDRGHFSEGAAADITLIDPEKGKAVETFVSGRVVMKRGALFGRGMTLVTTERGLGRAKALGCPAVVVEPSSPEPGRIRLS